MAYCPHCGSSNIRFQRERVGSYTHTSYTRTPVNKSWVFPAVSKTGGRTYGYRTVGICNDCGYTYTTAGSSGCAGNILLYIVLFVVLFFILRYFGIGVKSDEEMHSSSTPTPVATEKISQNDMGKIEIS